ncbi:MAG TPA: hypothetical protein VF384_11070 [Planctomycetota bacterium]
MLTLGLAGCAKKAEPKAVEEQQPMPTNRIAVPEAVRRNLGIEFVKVERRRVAQTLRFPGHFELLPTGKQEVRTPVQGRVSLRVRPLQQVKAGEVVAAIDSPTWREKQRELGEWEVQIKVADARLAAMEPLTKAHRAHEASLRDAVKVLEALEQNVLATQGSVGGQASELAAARAQLAQARAGLAEAEEKTAETEAAIAELRANLAAARDRLALGTEAAAAVLAVPVESLRVAANGSPVWRAIRAVELRAVADGVIDTVALADGAWAEPGELIAHAVDLKQVRFRARGLQSDLARLRAGLPAAAIPATSGANGGSVPGQLLIAASGDPAQRTIDLFVEPASLAAWARPGVAGFLEVETAGTEAAELAIPLAAALQDGLERVLFRRDPADADKVIRLQADLGLDDGKWVEVRSGLRDGDEVVLAGAYELMLASSGSAAKGGHFHADGTFHATDHK